LELFQYLSEVKQRIGVLQVKEVEMGEGGEISMGDRRGRGFK